jgi:hypothetical protein
MLLACRPWLGKRITFPGRAWGRDVSHDVHVLRWDCHILIDKKLKANQATARATARVPARAPPRRALQPIHTSQCIDLT